MNKKISKLTRYSEENFENDIEKYSYMRSKNEISEAEYNKIRENLYNQIVK